jgi:hypothetical protein
VIVEGRPWIDDDQVAVAHQIGARAVERERARVPCEDETRRRAQCPPRSAG